MRTPNPNIARRDDSDGSHERNRGTPRRARIGRSPLEDENSLQTEDRQNDLDQDGRSTITPNQHLRFYEGPDPREEPRVSSRGQADLASQIRLQIQELGHQLRQEMIYGPINGDQRASGSSDENYPNSTEGSYLQETDDASTSPIPPAMPNSQRLVDARCVPDIKYKKATTISLLNAKDAKLSMNDRNPRQKIKMMNVALEASGFYTLVTGSREPPIATTNNPNGYKAKSVIMEYKHGRDVGTIIPDDDCYRYDAEKSETYHLLLTMIDQNLHHLLVEQIADKDPERMYKALIDHFAGHKHHHIAHAKHAVENYHIDPNTVTLSISIFRELLLSLHDAQEAETTEAHKIVLLEMAMSKITEGILSEHYKHAKMSDFNFNDILEYLIKHSNHVNVPIIMAAVMQPDKPCYKFQSGNCTRNNCPFAHRKMTDKEMKDSNYDPNKVPKPMNKSKGKNRNHEKNKFRNNNSEGTNGMHNNKNNNNNNANPNKNYNRFSRPLTAQQIQAVGPPRGKVSPNNVDGLSKPQQNLAMALFQLQQNGNANQSIMNTGFDNSNQNNYNNMQHQYNSSNSHNNNTGGDFASWGNGTTYTPIANNGIYNNTMCMIQSSDDINIETEEPEPESKTQIPESQDTEHGPRTQIQGLNSNIQIDFYHIDEKPYYRKYFETKEYITDKEALPMFMYDNEESVEEEEQIVVNEKIQNTATKIHVQRLFGMNDNGYPGFKIECVF